MMYRLLLTEALKLKRLPIAFVLLLSVIGLSIVVALQSYFWKEEVMNSNGIFIMAVLNLFFPIVLLLGITILSSMIVGLEDDARNWKQLLTTKISKTKLYWSKIILIYGILFIMSLLIFVCMFIIWSVFVGPSKIVWELLFKQIFYPYFASFGVLSIQFFISIFNRNQVLPLVIGVIGAISGSFLARSSLPFMHFAPWTYPSLATPLMNEATKWAISGLLIGVVGMIFGAFLFSKKEVN